MITSAVRSAQSPLQGHRRKQAQARYLSRKCLNGRTVVLCAAHERDVAQLRGQLVASGARPLLVTEVDAAVERARGLGPTAAVVLLTEPDSTDVDAGLRLLRDQVTVVVLCPGADLEVRVRLLLAGADYALSSALPAEALAGLTAALQRSDGRALMVAASQVVSVGELSVDLAMRLAVLAGRPLSLTNLEFDLLAYLMQHAGAVLSREQLLADVWGFEVGSLDTVTVHIRRLRKKIELDASRPLLLRTVWGSGYRLCGQAVPMEDRSVTVLSAPASISHGTGGSSAA